MIVNTTGEIIEKFLYFEEKGSVYINIVRAYDTDEINGSAVYEDLPEEE